MARIKEERRKKRIKRIIRNYVCVAGLLFIVITASAFTISGLVDMLNVPDIPPSTEGNLVVDSQPDTIEDPVSETETVPSETVEPSEDVTELPPEPQKLQLVMVGDMLMHDRIIDSGLQSDGSYNFEHLFKNVIDFIQAADIAIVNQETIMGGPEFEYSGYPRFNSPYELADAEAKAGFNVILHATNHTTDKGKEAVLNCMNYWDTNYPEIAYLGINRTQEDQDNNIYVYEQNGIRVAILNYTYTLNGNRMPSDMPWLVNLMKKGTSEKRIIADIKKAEEIADFTVVCPHWGTEYSLEISKDQKYWTEIFLENGVDLVLGAHPHVIEPIEWLTHENGNKMLVYYSLGNFVNGTSSTKGDLAHRMVGGIADVTIGRDESGEVVVLEHSVVPIVCHMAKGDAYTVFYLKDYTEEMALSNLIVKQDSKFNLEACLEVVRQVWGME